MKSLLRKLKIGLLLLAVIAPALAQPTDNVVAYYPFNGNAWDVSGNLKNAVVSNATLTTDRLGNTNSAYYFNGSNNLLYLPNSLMQSSAAFSISCWFKPMGIHSTSDQSQAIIDLRGQYQISLSYYQSNYTTAPNTVMFNTYSSPNSKSIWSANNSILPGNWYYIVANYGNNIMELYVNGVLIGSCAQATPGSVSGYNNTIGKDYNVSLNRGWFYGSIDEVIVYKRGLTASEIQTIYNLGRIQKDLPLLYGPVSYNYDAMGNRLGRNVIQLKSAGFIPALTDSAGRQIMPEDPYEQNNKDYNIKIYPNPTQGELKVEITNFDFTQKSAIHVYNAAGKLVVQESPASGSNIINLLNQPNGMYVMKIVLGKKTSEWKIMKE